MDMKLRATFGLDTATMSELVHCKALDSESGIIRRFDLISASMTPLSHYRQTSNDREASYHMLHQLLFPLQFSSKLELKGVDTKGGEAGKLPLG
jgi:hypothetical protein